MAGDVELFTGIPAGTGVKLVDHLFEGHIEFLTLDFTLGSTSAVVRTKKELDADALDETSGLLYYSLMCDDTLKMHNIRILKVDDTNDNSPIFTKKVYNKEVSESLPVESEILRVTAKDADISLDNKRVSYALLPPAPSDLMMTSYGALILKKRLNYNIVTKYNLTVEAKDVGNLSDTASIIIDVKDFDNLSPYFNHSLYQASVQENETGPLGSILPEAIQAQDGDIGFNTPVVYSISTVTPSKYQSNFNIDTNSGVISILNAIDREKMDTNVISISIKAAQVDDSFKVADAVVSLTVEDVNDNPPEFDQDSYLLNLLENTPIDTVLFRAIVTDLDQGGFVGTLRILPESVPFTVGTDGTVKVKNSTALDRERTDGFVFQIEAREDNLPNRVVTADVNVTLLDENDNSPTFERNKYEGMVFTNQTGGELVTVVKADDPDSGTNGEVGYAIDFGNHEGFFSIDGNSGNITLTKGIPVDPNMIRDFYLLVSARDGGVVSRSSSVKVDITVVGDSKPRFTQSTYSGVIKEEQNPGVVIVNVGFLAADAVFPVILKVVTEADKFDISEKGEFSSRVKLDCDEAPQNYSVQISLSDGNSTDHAVVEVKVTDINDNAPVFDFSFIAVNVSEDTNIGTNITAMPATDKDSGFNGEIRYSLRGGEGKFFINPKSGMVSLAAALDRETKTEYSLEVVGEDQGRPAMSATATLLIQVSDVNDNTPSFNKPEYKVEVLETEAVNTTLLTLTAVDLDDGANGRVVYNITQQNPPSNPPMFQLDSSTGALVLAQVLDYSTVQGYKLMVEGTDAGTPSLVGKCSVVVKVKDVNNNPPEFSKDGYDVAVSENLPSGSSILTLEVTDRDEGGFSNGHFVYISDTFHINKQGVMSLKNDITLDRETKDNYILQVVAVDQPSEGLNATAQVNITVLDYNDNTPQFAPLPDTIEVSEGAYKDTDPGEVYRFTATDADIGNNGDVTISLSSPNVLFRLREDGTLLVVGTLDRETRDIYDLVIMASDKGSPQRENITTIQVTVTDVNDNTPVFDTEIYKKNILVKDAKEGDVVMTLSATDKDTANNSLVSYSFSAGSSPYLALNTKTGVVTLASDLDDVTDDTTIELTAMATDHGQPPLNSTVKVIVNLRIFSKVEGVAFESSSYNFSLAENQAPGTPVGVVKATSGSSLYKVNYTMTTHTDMFSIDASGSLTAKKALDREAQEWYILEVVAEDTRVPPTTAIALVRVQVQDVNEPPQFSSQTYKAKIFSITPYKTPVVSVKATDLDAGDSGQLVYSMSVGSEYFDVDGSTGLVYVVSAGGLAGEVATVEVKATDPKGLHATAKVEVEVQDSASSSDLVVISLNRPANIVEKKVPDLEESLGRSLGWTVSVISVSSTNGPSSWSLFWRESVKTLVSFIALDGKSSVSSQEVKKKLQTDAATVNAALEKVFGAGLQHNVEEEPTNPTNPTSNHSVVIALSVLLALTMVGLLMMVTFSVIKFRRMKTMTEDSDMDSFDFGRNNEGYMNTVKKNSGTWEQGVTSGGQTRLGTEEEESNLDLPMTQSNGKTENKEGDSDSKLADSGSEAGRLTYTAALSI